MGRNPFIGSPEAAKADARRVAAKEVAIAQVQSQLGGTLDELPPLPKSRPVSGSISVAAATTSYRSRADEAGASFTIPSARWSCSFILARRFS